MTAISSARIVKPTAASMAQWMAKSMVRVARAGRNVHIRSNMQAFFDYLEGYAHAFDYYPEHIRPPLHQHDAYAVIQDYWRVADDFDECVAHYMSLEAIERGGADPDGAKKGTEHDTATETTPSARFG